jgi:hypothetical protein
MCDEFILPRVNKAIISQRLMEIARGLITFLAGYIGYMDAVYLEPFGY